MALTLARIGPEERAEELEAALGKLAAQHVVETLDGIAAGRLKETEQDHALATVTRKITKEDGALDWRAPATEIAAKARAYHPWPGAHFMLELPKGRIKLRITQAAVHPDRSGRPGEVLEANKRRWLIACGSGALELLGIIPESKKEMAGAEFLRGCAIPEGSILPQAAFNS